MDGLTNALASADLAGGQAHPESNATHPQIPTSTDPHDPLAGPSGATAQTGGFAQAGTHSSPSSTGPIGGGFGGGLASSPNVPLPGTSIDPATGKPHTAGLTRAELEAKRAAESLSTTNASSGFTGGGLASSPNVPAPGTSIDAATGQPHTAGITRAELEAKRYAEALTNTTPISLSGGGLASSPNVPAPGTSINPATGEPHTAGLTRAELEAKRYAEALTNTTPIGLSGGGLASSPNVPAPGTSINPATGQPHTAGLTRAELDSQKAPAVGPTATEGKSLSELSGREQAARQLAGTVGSTEEVITPGKELPGGWGPAKQVPIPGSGPNAPTSVYEDIAGGLEKVGTAAFGLIPQGLKDALNPEAHVDKGKQPMGSPPKGRRSSVTAFLENAKHGSEKLFHDVQETFQSGRRESLKPARTHGTIGADASVLTQVKNFFTESVSTVEGQTQAKVAAPTGAGPVAPRTSLPSDEVVGALPGERSTGVGALPGKATEAGVAVLPEEKKLDPTLPLGSGGVGHEGVGDLPGTPSETSIAVLPEEKRLNQAALSGTNQSLLPGESPAGVGNVPGSEEKRGLNQAALSGTNQSLLTGESPASVGNLPGSEEKRDVHAGTVPLAPALPATVLGAGAAKGATDLEQAGLTPSNVTTAPSSIASGSATSALDTATPAESRLANDRTSSTASVTAIRHGHEGHRPSPLSESTVKETLSNESVGKAAPTDLAPGKATDGVGHPSSRGEGTAREPGTYPAPDHAGTGTTSTTKDTHAEPTTATSADKSHATKTTEEEKPSALAATTAAATAATSAAPKTEKTTTSSTSPTAPTSTTSPTSPTSPTSAASPKTSLDNGVKGHRRGGSTSSTGSNGKKKVGFMNKLKGEIKVIGGKIAHDEKKVEEGQKLKHGE